MQHNTIEKRKEKKRKKKKLKVGLTLQETEKKKKKKKKRKKNRDDCPNVMLLPLVAPLLFFFCLLQYTSLVVRPPL